MDRLIKSLTACSFQCLLAVLKVLVRLPYQWQMSLGCTLGYLSYYLFKRRRHIARVNLDLCFPELSQVEREVLVRHAFQSIGKAMFEALLAWFASDKKLQAIPFSYKGIEHLEQAIQTGQGVLLCSGHFTCLELIGRYVCQDYPLHLVMKRSRKVNTRELVEQSRKKYARGLVYSDQIRQVVRLLRQGEIVWYAPDQDFGRELSEMVTFLGVPTATLKATASLVKAGNALLVPCLFYRNENNAGYTCEFLPAFDHYPCGDAAADAQRYNSMLEPYVQRYPAQYLWVHRRFKTQPLGAGSVYS